MSDLRDNLQSALGTTYSIERELGGGGMSRVFLCVEQALNRRVVIKVLPPEMAASVSMERFRREIMFAARLQHPHIVPLLSAGETDGVPYLAMPFVDGESLRARLSRGGELPVAEGLRMLREVASALDYAHGQGVVHRDIKPDNVLLSHGSAMVTDFGVAKALSASTNAGERGVTSLGVSLGTPAYMSPEQAAASPDIDGRADLYAFGVLAYELFAGRPPFIGRGPQALLAAHVTEDTRIDPEAAAVAAPRTLGADHAMSRKRPADRPQTAAEIIAQLDAITTSSGGLSPTPSIARKRSSLLGVGIGVAVAVAAIALAVARRAQTPPAVIGGRASIAVLPFEVRGDTASRYFADGLTEELINLLAGIPSVRVVPRSTVFALSAKEMSDVAALGKSLGVSLVIEGNVRRSPGAIKVSAELIDAATNSVVASRSVERPAGRRLRAGGQRGARDRQRVGSKAGHFARFGHDAARDIEPGRVRPLPQGRVLRQPV
jgi:serine/threonine-protein kinase